jgi:hypothetical protein
MSGSARSYIDQESARLKHRASPCTRRPSTQDEHSAQRDNVLKDRYRSIANCSGQRVGAAKLLNQREAVLRVYCVPEFALTIRKISATLQA